jgi:rsbT co-antagonist protein RsbR
MTASGTPSLSAMLHERSAEILADWQRRLQALGGNYQRGLTPATEQAAEMAELLAAIALVLGDAGEAFLRDDGHALAALLRSASQVRAERGFSSEESLLYLQTCKESLVAALHVNPQAQHVATQHIERVMDRCVRVQVGSFVAAREELIRRQGESLREVSTPVISLWDSILLLPLVGVVDSVRAQQISERLLVAIAQSEAEVTLIDVTGVPVMDTSVARHILKTVTAAEMLGTRVILTGISPSTAQTMVKLGIDMSSVPTRASLKGGMALALTMTRRRIVDLAAG